MLFRKTPIALLQLLHQKAQTTAAAVGVTFITVLLFMQIGFRAGFLNTLTDLPSALNGDLFLLNASYITVLRPPQTSVDRLYSALAFEDVESVAPIYLSATTMKEPGDNPKFLRKIQVMGIPLGDHPALLIPGIEQEISRLQQSKAASLSVRSPLRRDKMLCASA